MIIILLHIYTAPLLPFYYLPSLIPVKNLIAYLAFSVFPAPLSPEITIAYFFLIIDWVIYLTIHELFECQSTNGKYMRF